MLLRQFLYEFWKVADSFRGPMWGKGKDGKWKLKNPIWEQEDSWKRVDIKNIIERESISF
mgnify:CR=1 FL=1